MFFVSLLEQNQTKKKQVDQKKNAIELKGIDNNKEKKIEKIWDNSIYTNKASKG